MVEDGRRTEFRGNTFIGLRTARLGLVRGSSLDGMQYVECSLNIMLMKVIVHSDDWCLGSGPGFTGVFGHSNEIV